MSATQLYSIGLLFIATALIWYAAGRWQGATIERERWEERAAQDEVAAQDELVQQGQQGQEPVQQGQDPVVPRRQPIRVP
jgi:hypothetical protein